MYSVCAVRVVEEIDLQLQSQPEKIARCAFAHLMT